MIFIKEFLSFLFSMTFQKAWLSLQRKSPVNIFNHYIFEISGFHWSKWTVECAICLTLILKFARRDMYQVLFWFKQSPYAKYYVIKHLFLKLSFTLFFLVCYGDVHKLCRLGGEGGGVKNSQIYLVERQLKGGAGGGGQKLPIFRQHSLCIAR